MHAQYINIMFDGRNSMFELVSHFCRKHAAANSDVEFLPNLIRWIEFDMTEMQRMNRALYISLMEKIAASDFVCSSSGHVLNMSGASAFGIAITKTCYSIWHSCNILHLHFTQQSPSESVPETPGKFLKLQRCSCGFPHYSPGVCGSGLRYWLVH